MLSVAEASLPRDHLKRMAATLDHIARGFNAQLFNCLGRRLPGFGLERAAELART
jgi:hypothetical protein